MLSDTKISKKIKNFIINDCEKRKHEEACGLLYKKNNIINVISCSNDSKTPTKTFIINESTVDEVSKKGQIIGYYHSHIHKNDHGLSWIDKAMSEYTHFFSILYHIHSKRIHIYKPCGWVAPLIGRDYYTGFFDSFSLIKDYYKSTISINNNFTYYRYIKPLWQISVNNNKALSKVVEKYGFFEIEHPKTKCLCILWMDGIIKEFAIYHNNKFLTHLFEEKSKKYTKKELTDKGYTIKYYWNGKLS